MAKRKRRKSHKKEQLEIKKEIYAILFILAAIIGLGKLGPVGRLFASFSLFLTGSVYMVSLVLILILGAYVFIKGEWPEFFSTKFLGFYLFVIGLLAFMHWEFVELNNGNISVIVNATIEQLSNGFNMLMKTGTVGDSVTVGGGFIGCLFASLFSILFSNTGMKIVSIVFLVGGIILFTGFSISDFLKSTMTEVKDKTDNLKKSLSGDDDEDDEEEEQKKVIISNGNEIEEVEKPTIKSIDDLKKPAQVEEIKEEKTHQNTVNPSYQLPPLDILDKPKNKSKGMDNAAIEANITKLEDVLRSFGVTAKVVEVHIGPTVAQYELEIAAGTRVNKITTLSREIALALSKKDVRIEAPIPGKSTVGVEFANDTPSNVSFYEIMASKAMLQNQDKKLMVPLGKSIMGDIGVCEINKMPHLLIAGTTGSGKSVCVNGVICSILMRAKPDEVKLALVDPKVVELSVYNGVPHLVCPVVSDPKQAAILLQKMVNEMEKRYHMFGATGTKKIEGYNEYVEDYNKKHPEEPMDKMPYIVIIIDELSDLMMVAAKEVEDSILRITQKARAAGIHLIVATQRPSTEVITGLIKANIPSRIAFAVGSGIDSRTILDQVGAEKLLGKGDMFFLPIGQNIPTRIQGSYITDGEIQKVIDFTKKQQESSYDDTFMNLQEEKKEENNGVDAESVEPEGDTLYDEIKDFVIKSQKASASLLQRKFKIGYNKAATMIDQLEEDGIIGPATGNSKPREVLYKYDNTDGE
ncbi:MAG: cell division protein FtsK [Bacilli bacterium]|nr:cell division protein FtsK [Bacilli bacterium]MBR6137745.1 cell division protein FtsK [Bacilli bacterium]